MVRGWPGSGLYRAPRTATPVTHEDAPRSSEAPAGYDEDDPYAEADVSEYPDWWRRNIELFRQYGMRPYRPPRFSDGEHSPPIIEQLETDLGVDVMLRAVEPRVDDDWTVLVDGRAIATIGRHRSGDGYTVYEVASTSFETMVRVSVE